MREKISKVINFIKILKTIKKAGFDRFAFHFLYKINSKEKPLKINLETKCLVLSHSIGAETKALGGLIAQHPKNFEILCLTNGSNLVKDKSPSEAAKIKKQQFEKVMQLARIRGWKIFDINPYCLESEFTKIKKMDISEADYIFIPNAFDSNPDCLALLAHFKKILENNEHKKTLKILMYESDNPLIYTDCHADISAIVQTKHKMLECYYPNKEDENTILSVLGLNRFRATKANCHYSEAFMTYTPSEFLKIPFL